MSDRTVSPTMISKVSPTDVPRPPFRKRVGSLLPLIFLAVLLLCWQVIPPMAQVPSYILPQLSDIVNALTDPSATRRYLYNAGYTLMSAGIGLTIGFTAGVVIGILLAEIDVLYRTFYPYVIAIQSIPKVALAPLFVIWFGFGIESKIVVVVLLSFFPVLVNTISGLKAVDPELIDLFRVNRASKWHLRRKLLIPAALPSIFTGLEIAVVMAMLGAIVAEFVGAQHGLGVLILQAQSQMQTAAVFALLIMLSAIGITFNLGVRSLRRRVVFWMPRK